MAVICPFKTDFSFSVSYDEFRDIILGIDSNEINIGKNDSKLLIKTKRTKSELTCFESTDVESHIESLNLKAINKKWGKLPGDFMEAVKLCIFSVSKDNTQPFLNCLFVDNNRILSSDDLRISLYKLKEGLGSSFLIPLAAVKELLRFKVTEFCLGESWVYFSTDEHVVFCSRIIEDNFPEVKDNFKFKGKRVLLPEGVEKSVKLVSILAEGDLDLDKRIGVKITPKRIIFKGERDIGWIEDNITFDLDIEKDISFSINPYLFLDILSRTRNIKIGEDRVLFEVDSYKHLMALFND